MVKIKRKIDGTRNMLSPIWLLLLLQLTKQNVKTRYDDNVTTRTTRNLKTKINDDVPHFTSTNDNVLIVRRAASKRQDPERYIEVLHHDTRKLKIVNGADYELKQPSNRIERYNPQQT